MTATIAIMQFPGSNCERETRQAIERAGMNAIDVLWYDQSSIDSFDGYVIIGGFSYEDRGRAGFVAAQDPVMIELQQQALKGKPILGICNGAQILVESGLVPGLPDRKLGAALTVNKRVLNHHVLGTGFYNTWCHVKPKYYQPKGVFGRYFSRPINIPLAHADGRFIIPTKVLNQLEWEGACLWQYCDKNGTVSPHFPVNPNGSVDNLAGISNASGNILALMPHPERSRNGDIIFESMRDYIEEDQPVEPKKFNVDINLPELGRYQCPKHHLEFITEAKTIDNEAITLRKTLKQQGYDFDVKRYNHWEIIASGDPNEVTDKLKKTNEILNPSKERITQITPKPEQFSWLVRDKANIKGQHKHEVFGEKYGMSEVEGVYFGTIWQIIGKDRSVRLDARKLSRRHFFFNPFAHEYYAYE